MNIQKYLIKTDHFSVAAKVEKVQQLLATQDFQKFRVVNVDSDGVYKIEANSGVGILIVNGSKAIGISTYATLTSDGEKAKVDLKTAPRPEYLLLLFGFAIILIGMMVNPKHWRKLPWIIGVFGVCLLWFRLVLQTQEEMLHNHIQAYLTQYPYEAFK